MTCATFRQAIAWVVTRNHDLLSTAERAFATGFEALPVPAQALLARLSMRRGALFRRSKIRYAEIEPLDEALSALIEIGWVDARPKLALTDLFRLATRAELARLRRSDGAAHEIGPLRSAHRRAGRGAYVSGMARDK
ncbi:hypothetical protein ACFPN2_20980 [Steroidobacter flavus]|uniref:Fanconi-associated nuclease 1-like winged-helix domain-containing protein n=1 Tax=Steroidobacter flavus TaxID=1842136 RepID=A0ABV8SVQ2_9GAMM